LCDCVVAVLSAFAQCRSDGQTTKQGDDAVKTRGMKRTPSDVERHCNNKCFRADVSTSNAAAVAAVDDDTVDNDDGIASGGETDRGDVESSIEVCRNAEDSQTEMTDNLQSDAIDTNKLTPEVDSLPVDPLSTAVLRNSDSQTSDGVALAANIYKTTDDVAMTSSKFPLPVISSTLCSEGPRSSEIHCSDIASTANTYCDERDTGDVTVTSSNLLPVASVTTKSACSGTTTFVPSGRTLTVGTIGLLPRALMPTRVGGILHSTARLFPFPVPMAISPQAPLVVGGSTVTLRPSVMPRWLPVPHASPSFQCPPPRRTSPSVIFTDYFRKQHETRSYGPQMEYYGATPIDCGGGSSDFRVCIALQPNSAEVPDGSKPLHRPVQPSSSSVACVPAPTCQSSQQVSADHKSTTSSDDLISKLDPVSRAVYDNFLGKLRTTTKPKTGTGRRRGHVNDDVTRRYRN